MKINRKIGIVLLCLLALGFAMQRFLPKDSVETASALRIGAGDDITGVLLKEIQKQSDAAGDGLSLIGSYIFVDCCASAAQWALQAEEIDLGFFCSQAAISMLRNNDDFEMYAPVILNGEIIAAQVPPEELRTLGVPRKRSFLKDIAQNTYPAVEAMPEINRAYLLVSMNSGDIDGAVLDVYDAARTGENVSFLSMSDTPYISYCLVVRRGIEETPAFQRFLALYEQAISMLNTSEGKIAAMGMDEAFWKLCGTEFLPLT